MTEVDLESEVPSDMQSLCIESDAGLPDSFWATFDLKQESVCPKLDLNLSCPLIIMPNLSEPTERFELDFGTIRITSKFIQEKQRWVNHPQRLFNSMAIAVHNSDLRFDFKTGDQDKTFKPILKEDNVIVDIIVPNSSPFFEEKDDRGAHIKAPVRIDKQGHTFDMDQVDTSVSVMIK